MAITTTRFLLLLTTAKSPSPSILRLACHRHHFLPPLFSFSHRHVRSQSSSFPPLKIKASSSSSFSHHFHTQTATSPFPSPPQFSSQLLWPEFSHFVNNLSAAGYFSKQEGLGFQIDGFVPVDGLPDEFISAANACLAFARDRDYLLRKLSRRDVEVLVENGTAGLFDNGDGALRRMRVFLESESGGVLSSESGTMIDLMKILLSCTSNLIYSENNNLHNREFLESSVRNLFSELAHLSCNAQEAIFSGSLQNKFSDSHGQISRPLRQNIEMKRGDWICPRCSFMNFARNMKCLECEEVRPKRQLTGGEWECPQCDFFNYGRNTMCLRCDCKRPGEVFLGITNSGSGLGYARDNYANNADIDKRLAENEEKAQRWFSKISQLDSTSDMSSAIADEDFPEIMPLRKGVNRFVVSTRKTPLERRLADAQYGRNSSNGGTLGINNAQSSATNDQTPRQALDDILGRKFAASDSNIKAVGTGQNSRTDAPNSVQQQYGAPRVSSSSYVPFVPLPADMFARKPENVKTDKSSKVEADNYRPSPSGVGEQMDAAFGSSENDKSGPGWLPLEMPADQSLSNDKEEKQNEQSDRWFKRVAELHNITDLATSIPDKESPEMMPMRKGENRFVVSKKKDRSLSSPTYKRRMAMGQANNTNYVPFVPFPPDYFAKKDTQQSDGANMTIKAMDVTSNASTQANLSGKSDHIGDRASTKAEMPVMENQQCSAGDWNSNSGKHLNQIRTGTTAATDPQFNMTNNQSSGFSWNDDNRGQRNVMANSHKTYSQAGGNNNIGSSYAQNENFNQMGNSVSTPQPPENQSSSNCWSGKSLEGSLVKEPDPLDMSEEAKAERWFRRVAQIKDISELSQIPDEDFPSIMPMRKGVNRFVVSKRKTPLERRLTSTQYRKDLPTVRSDPVKDNDST